jgi:hypothetical protein
MQASAWYLADQRREAIVQPTDILRLLFHCAAVPGAVLH